MLRAQNNHQLSQIHKGQYILHKIRWEIQIGLLTDKISKLSEHFKTAKKDKHSSVGLTKSVNKRKKLLIYLKKKNLDSYQKVIKQLNLRK